LHLEEDPADLGASGDVALAGGGVKMEEVAGELGHRRVAYIERGEDGRERIACVERGVDRRDRVACVERMGDGFERPRHHPTRGERVGACHLQAHS
jgi:hypothetical protein